MIRYLIRIFQSKSLHHQEKESKEKSKKHHRIFIPFIFFQMKSVIIELYSIMIKRKTRLLRNLFLKFMMRRKFKLAIYHRLFHIDCINSQVNIWFLNLIDELFRFYLVNTTEGGNGLLNVKIKQNGNRLNHEQIQIVPHVYEISFIPETSDECLISISFNGENNCKF